MRDFVRDIDALLRGSYTSKEQLQAGTVDVPVRTLAQAALVLGAVYGVMMGLFAVFTSGLGGLLQLVATTIKVPLLFMLTLVVTFPSLYVFSALARSRLKALSTFRLVLAALTLNLAVLASFGPVTAFFTLSTTSYPFMVLLNVFFFGVAGLVGLVFLRQALNVVFEPLPAPETAEAAPEPSGPSAAPGPSQPSVLPAPSQPSELPGPTQPSALPGPTQPSESPVAPETSAASETPRPPEHPAPTALSGAPASPEKPDQPGTLQQAAPGGEGNESDTSAAAGMMLDTPGLSPYRPPARPAWSAHRVRPAIKRDLARQVFTVWLVIYCVVGAQMGWILRPFIGTPDMPFQVFRAREFNFFHAIIRAIAQLFS